MNNPRNLLRSLPNDRHKIKDYNNELIFRKVPINHLKLLIQHQINQFQTLPINTLDLSHSRTIISVENTSPLSSLITKPMSRLLLPVNLCISQYSSKHLTENSTRECPINRQDSDQKLP